MPATSPLPAATDLQKVELLKAKVAEVLKLAGEMNLGSAHTNEWIESQSVLEEVRGFIDALDDVKADHLDVAARIAREEEEATDLSLTHDRLAVSQMV